MKKLSARILAVAIILGTFCSHAVSARSMHHHYEHQETISPTVEQCCFHHGESESLYFAKEELEFEYEGFCRCIFRKTEDEFVRLCPPLDFDSFAPKSSWDHQNKLQLKSTFKLE